MPLRIFARQVFSLFVRSFSDSLNTLPPPAGDTIQTPFLLTVCVQKDVAAAGIEPAGSGQTQYKYGL